LPGINAPYRGWKATFFEGGIHVPYFIKWPTKFPKGVTFHQPVAHADIFATAAAAAGAQLPADRTMDGVDIAPFVIGTTAAAPHTSLYWRSGHYKVLRSGDWKLQVSARPDKIWLFNLKDDPTEKTNLAASQPEKVAELRLMLNEVDAAQTKSLWPSLIEAPVSIDKTLEDAQIETDEYVYWAN
jgi:arylsulfatase A-like enzyme